MKMPFWAAFAAPVFLILLIRCSPPNRENNSPNPPEVNLEVRPPDYTGDSTEAFDLLHRCEIYAYMFSMDTALILAKESVKRFEDLYQYTRDTLTMAYYADSYFNLGYLYQLKNQNDSAFKYLNISLDLCKRHLGEDHLIATKCLIKIGNCYREYGDLVKAKLHFLKAYEIRIRTMDSLNTFLVNINSVMAAYYWHMGDVYNADIFATREQSLIRRLYDYFVVQHPHISDAVFYKKFLGTGNRPPVVRNLLLSNIPRMYMTSTLNLARRFLDNGEPEKAEYYAAIADSLQKEHDPDNARLRQGVLNIQANIHLYKGEKNQAEKLLREIEYWPTGPTIPAALADSYFGIGKYNDGLRVIDNVLAETQNLTKFNEFNLLEVKARALYLSGRDEDCLKFCSDILTHRLRLNVSSRDTQPIPWQQYTGFELMRIQAFLRPWIQSLTRMGIQFNDLKMLNEAYGQLQTFHESMVYIQDQLYVRESKTNRVQYLYPFYEDMMNLCLKLYQSTGKEQFAHDVFYLSDLVKAFQLKEMQEKKNLSTTGSEGRPRTQEEQMKLDLANLRDQILELESTAPAMDSLKWFNLKKAQSELTGKFELYAAGHPTGTAKTYNPFVRKEFPMQQLQSKLREQRAELLDYFVGQKHLYILLVNGDGYTFQRQELDPVRINELNGLSRQLAEPKTSINNDSVAFYSSRLFDFLIRPVYSSMEEKNWIVVPDHWISGIPFECLRPSHDDTSAMLLANHIIRYEYSSTMILNEVIKPESKLTYAGFAPQYGNKENYTQRSLDSVITSRVLLANREALGSLTFNEPEIKESAEMWQGAAYTGPRVDKSIFLQQGPKARILHLAMHALTDNSHPEYSQLIFKQPDDSGSSEALFAYELARIPLKAELSVLSACNSGSGEYRHGEGILSLARAFKAAGCPNIVMSLWQANDASTREIVVGFFKNLRAGMGKADALRKAKLDYLKNTSQELRHPYYWAGLVLVGDNEPVLPENPNVWVIGLAVILFLSTLLIYLVRRQYSIG